MTTITSNADLTVLQRKLQGRAWSYDHIGLRVVDCDYDDYDAEIGTTIGPSHIWDDGEWTDAMLSGSSAIDLYATIGSESYMGYYGRRVLVIGSHRCEHGEDRGEIILRDAVVLDVIDL